MIHIHPSSTGKLQDQHSLPGMNPAVITGARFADHECTVIDSAKRYPVEFKLTHHVIGIIIRRAPDIHHRHIGKAGISAIERVKGIQPFQIYVFFKRREGIFHVPSESVVSRKYYIVVLRPESFQHAHERLLVFFLNFLGSVLVF